MRAPELNVAQWFNTNTSLSLESFRGRVLVMHAFQMLCPGCVHYGIPQMQRIHQELRNPEVAVIGIHTVFEHHAAMTPEALAVFIHENRLQFPIAVDTPGTTSGMPLTMKAYDMGGTPTTILIDRNGYVRFHKLGHVDDLALGTAIGQLIAEKAAAS